MKAKLIAATAVAALCTSAFAEFVTGNLLLQRMNSDSAADRTMALGYVAGVHDVTEGIVQCSGNNVTLGQVRDIAKQYLVNNPSVRDMSAHLMVGVALQQAFPCANKPNNNKQGSRL